MLRFRNNVRVFGTISPVKTTYFPAPNWRGICGAQHLVSWLIGNRDGDTAAIFIKDLKTRLANRVQLTTDGHKAYLQAMEEAFWADIDYAILIKLYGASDDPEHRYSPSECIGIEKKPIMGTPNGGGYFDQLH